MKYTGVTSRGIITPIFREGDDIVSLITNNLIKASKEEGFVFHDRDVVGVTEAIVARTQGNYATIEQIAQDVKNKFDVDNLTLGVVFPILSRNRFAVMLRAFSMAANKVYVQLSFPSDGVGNHLIPEDIYHLKYVNSASIFTESSFRDIFGYKNTIHPFTGVDYIEYYKNLGDNIEIIFSNEPTTILMYTNNVINCDIHTRKRTKNTLLNAGAYVYSLDDILTSSVNGSGYNPTYGLLGANKATENKVKLFPRNCNEFVYDLQESLYKATGKKIEVLIYGDGGFKDPVGGIWELADPVISPAYTDGLRGTPNELKMKYFADNEFKDLSGEKLIEAMKEKIKRKDENLVGEMESQGTTPRQLTDLIGSLCDLTSGSGDRGTPVVLIQNYFSNYSTE